MISLRITGVRNLFWESGVNRFGSFCYFYIFGSRSNSYPYAYGLSVGNGLLSGMWIIGKLNITVGFGKREFHTAHVEWKLITRNAKNRWVFPTRQLRAGTPNWENISRKSKIAILGSLGGARGFRRYFGRYESFSF